MDNDPPARQNPTPHNDFEQQLIRLCEGSGANSRVALRIMLAVVDGIQESISRALEEIDHPALPRNFTPPPALAPAPALEAPAAIVAPAAQPPPLAPPVLGPVTPPVTPPIAAAAAPVRMLPSESAYFCILVGRQTGVFPGPW